jgi:hypothetical protein
MSFANCSCGTTLGIGSESMPAETLMRLLSWAQSETARRGITFGELLVEVRAEIDRIVLAAADEGRPGSAPPHPPA